MKLLSRYILKEHIAPFLFAFFTITFLLIIEYLPKIVNHVIDKDISVMIALELLVLNLAWMLALSVPMSVLVATLMAFGRLTGDFEIIAIKTSGINLMRVMIPVLLAGCVVTYGMIEFNDRILPDLNKQARELWGNISQMRPTLVFRSGVFISDIPGYLVQIDKIDHSTSRVEGVSIANTKDPNKPEIVMAEYGYLKMTDDGKNMEFTLYNGEDHVLDLEEPDKYRKVDFDWQVINITGTGSELQRDTSAIRNDREMGINQMTNVVLENLKAIPPHRDRIYTNLQQKLDYLYSDDFTYLHNDTVSTAAALSQIQKDAKALNQFTERNRRQIETRKKTMSKYKIEIYKKYSIPAASLAFILIGAPLGVLSKKGGMGISIAISIALFTIYWAFLIGGEDLADRGLVSPFWAMWSANFLLTALGLYLLYVVVTEKPIFAWFRRKK